MLFKMLKYWQKIFSLIIQLAKTKIFFPTSVTAYPSLFILTEQPVIFKQYCVNDNTFIEITGANRAIKNEKASPSSASTSN